MVISIDSMPRSSKNALKSSRRFGEKGIRSIHASRPRRAGPFCGAVASCFTSKPKTSSRTVSESRRLTSDTSSFSVVRPFRNALAISLPQWLAFRHGIRFRCRVSQLLTCAGVSQYRWTKKGSPKGHSSLRYVPVAPLNSRHAVSASRRLKSGTRFSMGIRTPGCGSAAKRTKSEGREQVRPFGLFIL